MLRAEGTALIAAEPRDILELVLDLDRYRQADRKIRAVKSPAVVDAGGHGTVRYRASLRGFPTPVDTNEIELVRWSHLVLRGAPRVWTRWCVDFEGRFDCTPTDGGTLVHHSETFWFKPAPLRWSAEAYLGRWLDDEMDREIALLKQHLEAPRPTGVDQP
jgi:hypothetical protein